MSEQTQRLQRLAAWALGINVGVILLGAFVRATGSGAGCGRSWPSCQGELIPGFSEQATLIEFLHRATSGIALLVVLVLAVMLRRTFEKGSQARTAGFLAMIAIIGEALIGAGIVLFQWVADDASVARAVAVPLHLVNTLLLLAALTAVVFLSRGRRVVVPDRDVRKVIVWGLGSMVVVAATGAVAALADTLFPSTSLVEGLAEEFSGTSAFLTRLRVVHPFAAVATGVLLVWLVTKPTAISDRRESAAARIVVWLVVVQVLAGAVNVVLLVPVWMQIVHLLLADALWISFVWFSLECVVYRTHLVSESTNSS